MEKDWSFRFSLPRRPQGREVSAEELERILRARVAELPAGSAELGDAQWQLLRFLSLTGRQGEALRGLESMLATTSEPEVRAGLTLAMGQLMEQLGDFGSAIEAYSRGVALEPVGVRVWYLLHNNLGYCLNKLGRHAEGERWCRTAIHIAPERHNAHKNLGIACEGQGRYAEAANCFVAAVRAEASDARALRCLEELVAAHPEVATEIADLDEQVELCRAAVAEARRQAMLPPDPAGPTG